jgi:hypothetical protein
MHPTPPHPVPRPAPPHPAPPRPTPPPAAAGHPLGPEALAALAPLRRLRALDLANTRAGDGGAAALAAGPLGRRLGELSLRNCFSISNAGAVHLAALTGLTSLDLTGCWRVSGQGLRHLATTKLLQLRLGFCEQVSDAAVAELAAGCPRLQLLDLSWCPEVGDGGLAALGKQLAGLRRLWLARCGRWAHAGRLGWGAGWGVARRRFRRRSTQHRP